MKKFFAVLPVFLSLTLTVIGQQSTLEILSRIKNPQSVDTSTVRWRALDSCRVHFDMYRSVNVYEVQRKQSGIAYFYGPIYSSMNPREKSLKLQCGKTYFVTALAHDERTEGFITVPHSEHAACSMLETKRASYNWESAP